MRSSSWFPAAWWPASRPPLQKAAQQVHWAQGAFPVNVVPRIGTASAMAATIVAQLITGLVLDHYGLFGFRTVPFDGKRALGVLLLLFGAGLVFRR